MKMPRSTRTPFFGYTSGSYTNKCIIDLFQVGAPKTMFLRFFELLKYLGVSGSFPVSQLEIDLGIDMESQRIKSTRTKTLYNYSILVNWLKLYPCPFFLDAFLE